MATVLRLPFITLLAVWPLAAGVGRLRHQGAQEGLSVADNKTQNAQSEKEVSAPNDSISAATAPANQRDKLIPPPGTAWRGSTIGKNDDAIVTNPGFAQRSYEEYAYKYGVPLQLYRHFAYSGPVIEPWVTEFVQKGGILWYNILPMECLDWLAGSVPACENDFRDHALTVKTLAPAKVFLTLFHEPAYVANAPNRSSGHYRSLWDRARAVFSNEGVVNVVWAMDYSTHVISDDAASKQIALDLWPGADKVDWLFFNAFSREDGPTSAGDSFAHNVTASLNFFQAHSDGPCGNGHQCDFNSVSWGIGAFGCEFSNELVHDGLGTPSGPHMFPPQRLDMCKAWTTAVRNNMNNFPQIKAYVYYDARASSVEPYPFWGVSEEYKDLLNATQFTANDHLFQNLSI